MDNQAALDHLKTRSSEGKIPQKCVYKKKLTLGSDPMQQLATDALNLTNLLPQFQMRLLNQLFKL